MNCFHCNRHIKYEIQHIEVWRKLGPPGVRSVELTVLTYCEDCFYEMAGDEYKIYFDKIQEDQEDQELNNYEKDLLDNKQVIKAIKSLRVRTGLGLKDAKDKVDAYRYGRTTVNGSGII